MQRVGRAVCRGRDHMALVAPVTPWRMKPNHGEFRCGTVISSLWSLLRV